MPKKPFPPIPNTTWDGEIRDDLSEYVAKALLALNAGESLDPAQFVTLKLFLQTLSADEGGPGEAARSAELEAMNDPAALRQWLREDIERRVREGYGRLLDG